jgi:hypothetical protein
MMLGRRMYSQSELGYFCPFFRQTLSAYSTAPYLESLPASSFGEPERGCVQFAGLVASFAAKTILGVNKVTVPDEIVYSEIVPIASCPAVRN